jgi:hypothetical protein
MDWDMTYRLSGPGARASKTEAVINIIIVSISNIIFSEIYYNLFFRSLHEKLFPAGKYMAYYW